MNTRKGKHRDVMSPTATPAASPVAGGVAENDLGAMSGRRAEESSTHETDYVAPIDLDVQPVLKPEDTKSSEELPLDPSLEKSQPAVSSYKNGAASLRGENSSTVSATVVTADSAIAKLEEGSESPVMMARVPEPLEKGSFVVLTFAFFMVLACILGAAGFMLVTESNKSDRARDEVISSACSKYTDPAEIEFCITRANDARNDHMKSVWTWSIGGIIATLGTSLVGYFVYKGVGKHKGTIF